jgi:predicted phosphohydrolase
MELAFDLISDLHLESWQDNDWTGRATSQHCVVAGDVCKDRADLIKFLRHLGTCYQGVFYIDGNDEHKLYMDKLSSSYRDLASRIRSVPNVIYLQDNVVVINGVAIVGTNGWWSFDFDLGIDAAQSRLWLEEKLLNKNY